MEDYIKKSKESGQKQHSKQKDQQNNSNKETNEKEKKTIWIFLATNWPNLIREDLSIAKKKKL